MDIFISFIISLKLILVINALVKKDNPTFAGLSQIN